jgi:phosphatidylglycerol:prolipoprotein diacylglycerol transferase
MPNREAFHIGPFQIGNFTIDIPVHWYGIVIMLGVVVAAFISFREARRRGEDPDHVWQMFPWVLIFGIVGARAGFIISQLGDPRYQDMSNWIRIWEGGLSIQGAIVGGVVALIVYCRRYSLSFFKWADIIVPGLALAQAIGRWGNYFNQEAFGSRCDYPWCIPISPQRQTEVAGITNPDPNARFHPTFAYEMIWDLMTFGLLIWLGRQRRWRLREGDLMWVYLIVYSIGRFLIEQIRVDSATVGDLKTPAIVAILTIAIAGAALIYRHRPGSTVPYSEVNLPEGAVQTPAATGDSLALATATAGAVAASPSGAETPQAAQTPQTSSRFRVRRVHSFTQADSAAQGTAEADKVAQE